MTAEKIIKQIKKDSENEIDQIIKTAEEQAKNIISTANKEAEQESKKILSCYPGSASKNGWLDKGSGQCKFLH